MDGELERIALRIRTWREEAGLTLQELADKSGVSASTIHKIENNNTVPTISVILKVTHGLGRRPDELFERSPNENQAALVRRGQHHELETQPGTRVQRVAGGLPRAVLDVWRVIHAPGCGVGSHIGAKRLMYKGELVMLVECGELYAEVGEEKYLLHAGDSLHFKSTMPHLWHNQSDAPVSVLFFATLPRGAEQIAAQDGAGEIGASAV